MQIPNTRVKLHDDFISCARTASSSRGSDQGPRLCLSPRGLQERIVRISNRSARSGLASGDDPAPRLHHRGRIHPIGHFQIGASGRLDADSGFLLPSFRAGGQIDKVVAHEVEPD
ncbi:hypothetical protein CFAM422_011183 [Trichoderma lentiforme]|uniref:Uncharacterized protein n=1 Tax=Trichoderma lentiforme TaxID=1567552 RepID=A0A9P4X6Z5_9HYPO|nr:hypothetical protein CFAM422_011183 [Trichoderma lentiforme]